MVAGADVGVGSLFLMADADGGRESFLENRQPKS
jgi:hypothetical protein